MHVAAKDSANIRMSETCSELTVKSPGRRQLCPSCVFIVDFGQILHIVLLFPLMTLNN